VPVSEDLTRDGYALLPGLVAPEACAAVVAAWAREVRPYTGPLLRQLTSVPEVHALSADGLVTNPVCFPARLTAFADFSRAELTVMRGSELVPTVTAALGGPPALLQSAYYESSTGTLPHVDCNPLDADGQLLGAWVALCDIGPGAGRFFVVPGSHRVPRDARFEEFAELAWAGYRAAFVERRGPWTETASAALWAEIEAENGLARHAPALRAGDVVLWDRRTVHGSLCPAPGGGPRHSLLMHFVPLAAVQDRVAELPGA
jgi:phytanoyl-CoA hydroxylase